MKLSTLPFALKTLSHESTSSSSDATSPSPIGSSQASARLPRVVLFGGQDSPSEERLERCWRKSCDGLLPHHRLKAVAWPARGPLSSTVDRSAGAEHDSARKRPGVAGNPRKARVCGKLGPMGLRLQGVLERPLARALTAVMTYLDANMRLDAQGHPHGLPSRLVHHYSRFSMDAMYNRDGLGDALVGRAVEELRRAPVDLLVAHSFGGTVALRAAWELWMRGERDRRFTLITLGTASGPTVARSPMLSGLPRTPLGQISRLPNLTSWHHFWSPTDVLVGASMLPRDFQGVELHCVDTGPLSRRAHALSSYLAAPEVMHRIGLAIRAERMAGSHARDALQASLESVRSLPAPGSNSEK